MIIAGADLSINSSGIVKFTLDEELNVVDRIRFGFTDVKKNTKNDIHFYHKINSFPNYFDKNFWMRDEILKFLEDVEYIAIEDYAFAAKGKVFHIGEFTGLIKHQLYKLGKKIRLYDPGSIKIYAGNKGNCDKISMYDSFLKINDCDKINIKDLPIVKKSSGNPPTSDLIDSYYIADLLLQELRLRKGMKQLKEYPEYIIKVFNRVTKNTPINILAQDFYDIKNA